jgi:hypothetical protein
MYVELNAKVKLCYGWAEQVLISTPIKRHMVPQRMKSVTQETSVTLWLGLMVGTHNLFVLFFLEQQLMVGSSADSVACLHSFGIVKPTFGLFNPFSGVAEVTITDTQVHISIAPLKLQLDLSFVSFLMMYHSNDQMVLAAREILWL